MSSVNGEGAPNAGSAETFDFKSDHELAKTFADDYLRQYYTAERPVTDDEKAVCRFIHSIAPKLGLLGRAIDIGCGPTVHHALMLAPYVKSLYLADYLEENFAPVKRWVAKEPGAWDWARYTSFCLEVEGSEITPAAVDNREMLTRSRIEGYEAINLLVDPPLGKKAPEFDLVTAFYCTEEIALTLSAWKKVIHRTVGLLRPGGSVLLACLEDTDFYHVQASDGTTRSLPSARITADDLKGVLLELGFKDSAIDIRVERTPSQADEGVTGVLLAFATGWEGNRIGG